MKPLFYLNRIQDPDYISQHHTISELRKTRLSYDLLEIGSSTTLRLRLILRDRRYLYRGI